MQNTLEKTLPIRCHPSPDSPAFFTEAESALKIFYQSIPPTAWQGGLPQKSPEKEGSDLWEKRVLAKVLIDKLLNNSEDISRNQFILERATYLQSVFFHLDLELLLQTIGSLLSEKKSIVDTISHLREKNADSLEGKWEELSAFVQVRRLQKIYLNECLLNLQNYAFSVEEPISMIVFAQTQCKYLQKSSLDSANRHSKEFFINLQETIVSLFTASFERVDTLRLSLVKFQVIEKNLQEVWPLWEEKLLFLEQIDSRVRLVEDFANGNRLQQYKHHKYLIEKELYFASLFQSHPLLEGVNKGFCQIQYSFQERLFMCEVRLKITKLKFYKRRVLSKQKVFKKYITQIPPILAKNRSTEIFTPALRSLLDTSQKAFDKSQLYLSWLDSRLKDLENFLLMDATYKERSIRLYTFTIQKSSDSTALEKSSSAIVQDIFRANRDLQRVSKDNTKFFKLILSYFYYIRKTIFGSHLYDCLK